MIAATIPRCRAGGDPDRAVALASVLALMTGAIMVLAGRSRSSASSPTCCPSRRMIGYMNGLALTILIGQLPKLLGFSVDADGFIDELVAVVGIARRRDVVAGRRARHRRASSHPGLSRWLPGCPACWSWSCSRSVRDRLRPRRPRRRARRHAAEGLPTAHRPDVASATSPCWSPGRSASRWSRSPTRSPPPRRSRPGAAQEIDGNQEMIGIGAANWPPASSRASRSAPAGRAPRSPSRPGAQDPGHRPGRRGGHHPMLVLVPGLFRNLPQPALAAVVITAALSLADIPGLRRLRRQRTPEFLLSIAASSASPFSACCRGSRSRSGCRS